MEKRRVVLGLGIVAVVAVLSVSMVIANNAPQAPDTQAAAAVSTPAPLVQEAPQQQVNGEVQQTILQVSNLSCGSCLYTIEGELKKYEGMVGMGADLRQGLVSVTHTADFTDEQIAKVITGAGYPARVLGQAELNQPARQQAPAQGFGGGGCGSGRGCGSGGCGLPPGNGFQQPPTQS